MKKEERCGRCGERATQVVTRRNDKGRVTSVLRACDTHAAEATGAGAVVSFDITPPKDIAYRRNS